LGYFRDLMAAAVGCGPEQYRYATPDQAGEMAAASGSFGLETILAAVQILEQTLGKMRYSVHGRTLAEVAVVRLCRLDDLDALPALIAELRGAGPPQSGRGTGPAAGAAGARPGAPASVVRTSSGGHQAPRAALQPASQFAASGTGDQATISNLFRALSPASRRTLHGERSPMAPTIIPVPRL
jgi:DNA polymerase-3 subunit gamma/tau